jgi:hypothetical protein
MIDGAAPIRRMTEYLQRLLDLTAQPTSVECGRTNHVKRGLYGVMSTCGVLSLPWEDFATAVRSTSYVSGVAGELGDTGRAIRSQPDTWACSSLSR